MKESTTSCCERFQVAALTQVSSFFLGSFLGPLPIYRLLNKILLKISMERPTATDRSAKEKSNSSWQRKSPASLYLFGGVFPFSCFETMVWGDKTDQVIKHLSKKARRQAGSRRLWCLPAAAIALWAPLCSLVALGMICCLKDFRLCTDWLVLVIWFWCWVVFLDDFAASMAVFCVGWSEVHRIFMQRAWGPTVGGWDLCGEEPEGLIHLVTFWNFWKRAGLRPHHLTFLKVFF